MAGNIKVLIADDHFVVRRGTRGLLSGVTEIEVVGEATDGREAVAQADKLHPDVVLMDLMMPEMDGIEACRQILDQRPETGILIVTGATMEEAGDEIFAALRAGALGYLCKSADREQFVRAVRQAYRQELVLPLAVSRQLLTMKHESAPETSIPSIFETVSERGREILQWLDRDWSDQRIARHLDVAEATVRSYISRMLHKLGFLNRVDMMRAYRAGRQQKVGEENVDPVVPVLVSDDPAAESLTRREVEILRLLAKGWSNRRISREMNIAETTVRSHVSHLLGKLGVSNRVEATLFALREGLTTLEECANGEEQELFADASGGRPLLSPDLLRARNETLR